MDTLYIVMPAYNEEANIERVVDEWHSILYRGGASEQSKIVVADSGSTDSTHEVLKLMKSKYPRLEILSDTGKQHGPKVIALYDYAIKNNADYIFQTDSDGQTVPQDFDDFWQNREEFEAILGNRMNREDGQSRVFVEKVVTIMLFLFFGVKIPDANAPFRLMNKNIVKEFLYRMPSDYNLPNIMLTTFFVYYNRKVDFRKITFRQRQGGKNSINVLKIFKIGLESIHNFAVFRRQMKGGME